VGFIPLVFREDFCMAKCNKLVLMEKGSGRTNEMSEDVALRHSFSVEAFA